MAESFCYAIFAEGLSDLSWNTFTGCEIGKARAEANALNVLEIHGIDRVRIDKVHPRHRVFSGGEVYVRGIPVAEAVRGPEGPRVARFIDGVRSDRPRIGP